jgi:hypothetical protein
VEEQTATGGLGDSLRRNAWGLALGAVALIAGMVMRWWILASSLGTADLDESAVGVQALRFGDCEFQAFFLGQPYGGTLETGLVAIVLRLFGSSVVALKVAPMLLAAAAALVCWRIAVRLGLNRFAQWAVPILVWLGPAFSVWQSTKERGFYGVAFLLATLTILIVLRLADRPTVNDAVALGVVVGLGWWQTPLTVLVVVPAIGWLLLHRWESVRIFLWSGPAAVAASLPWFWWNAANDWQSLDSRADFGSSYGDRLVEFFERMQVVFGFETPFDAGRQLVPFRWAGVVFLIGVVFVAALRTRARAPGFLAWLAVGYAILYSLNGLVVGVGPDPRYAYLFVPIGALCIGAVLPDPPSDPWRFVAGLGLVAVATIVSMWGLVGMRDESRRPSVDIFLASPGTDEVAELLEERGVTAFHSDLGGMQIAYLTEEEIIGSSFAAPRDAAYEVAARDASPSTYVLDNEQSGNADRLRRYLEAEGIAFDEQTVGQWSVFLIDQPVQPEEAELRIFGGRVSAPEPIDD